MISLHQDQLTAFMVLCREQNFTRAAKALHITQPSLSKRITALEESLDLPLIERSPRHFQITRHGQIVLRHCTTLSSLENELFSELGIGTSKDLYGSIRIASKSTLVNQLAIPALSPLMLAYPEVTVDFQMDDFPSIQQALIDGRVDIGLNGQKIKDPRYENIKLGDEYYALAVPKKKKPNFEVFLDAGPEDPITADFFRRKKKSKCKPKRLFLHNNEGIIQGMNNGLGVSVLEARVIKQHAKDLAFFDVQEQLRVPVYLQYRKQKNYSRVFTKSIECISEKASEYFSDKE